MTIRRLLFAVLALLTVWSLWWAIDTFAASEKTQMLRQQAAFLHALEDRKWSAIDAMICNDYEDDFQQDAAMVRQNLRELLRGFFFLSIKSTTEQVMVVKGAGFVEQKIKLEGNGAGISSLVVSRANAMTTPWIFHWHKRGRWPWSWELVQIHNRTAP
jgi:hypothetical protein